MSINLGNHFYLDEVLGSAFEGQSYDKIKDKAEEIKELGIDIDTHRNYVDSSEPKGTIISMTGKDMNCSYVRNVFFMHLRH